jgi:hypothetical protein
MNANTARTHEHRWIRRLGLASSIAVLVAFGVAGCSSSDDSSKSSDTTTTSTTAPSQQSGGSGQGGSGSQSGGGQSGGTQSGGGATGPTPTIVSFTTPENIDCHNGNQQNFSASWETTNATKVTISGGSGDYPATGSTSLPFDCSSAHTFTLTAYGSGGQTATRSITLQPRNVQPETSDAT